MGGDSDELPQSQHWSTKNIGNLLSSFNKKRRHLFEVKLQIIRVVSLPYNGGKFFFKIRLLNGGNHIKICDERFEINENKVEFALPDEFIVKMYSRIDTFVLDNCLCRISIRKEGRGGRGYEKIGYYDLDLASYAGSGCESKACLLNGYNTSETHTQRGSNNPANAYLEIKINCELKQGDIIFKRPDTDRPYIHVERVQDENDDETSSNHFSPDETILTVEQQQKGGHSRQTSKGSMKSLISNQSAVVVPTIITTAATTTTTTTPSTTTSTTNGGSKTEKCHHRFPAIDSLKAEFCNKNLHNSRSDPNIQHYRQASDDSTKSTDSIKRSKLINKPRRPPFIDEFGDIQQRLQSTRVDANEIVNNVMLNAKTIQNTNGFLCLMYNEDGTSRVGGVGGASSTNSLFVT